MNKKKNNPGEQFRDAVLGNFNEPVIKMKASVNEEFVLTLHKMLCGEVERFLRGYGFKTHEVIISIPEYLLRMAISRAGFGVRMETFDFTIIGGVRAVPAFENKIRIYPADYPLMRLQKEKNNHSFFMTEIEIPMWDEEVNNV